LAVIALFAFEAVPPYADACTQVTARTPELEPHRSATNFDDFEDDTDRVHKLAGLEADHEILNRNSTRRIEPTPSTCILVRAVLVSG